MAWRHGSLGRMRRSIVTPSGFSGIGAVMAPLSSLLAAGTHTVAVEPPVGGGYYVSTVGNATDSQATYNAAANVATPCAPSVAFKYATAGDTVYFRGGTYNLNAAQPAGPPPPCVNKPANSGTAGNPITFRNYPGETPSWNAVVPLEPGDADFLNWYTSGGVPTTKGSGYPINSAVVLAVQYRDYITFDGFRFVGNGGTKLGVGKLALYHCQHITIKNCTFFNAVQLPDVLIGATHNYDNLEFLRIDESSDVLVQNCTFQGLRQAYDLHNASAIKSYHNTPYWIAGSGIAIKNCEFSNNTTCIYFKSSTPDTTIEDCYFHDNYQHVLITPQSPTVQYYSDRHLIHNNLFVNPSAKVGGTGPTYTAAIGLENESSAAHGDDVVVSNNTFYLTATVFSFDFSQLGHGARFYNNVSQGCRSTYDLSGADVSATDYCRLDECDYNNWGTGSIGFEMGRNVGFHRYSSLSAWRAANWIGADYQQQGGTSPDMNSVAVDPQFAGGATPITIADFAITAAACIGTGKSGANMGCDVATVGVNPGGLTFTPAPGFALTSGPYSDGRTITLTKSAGGFGAKPNGQAPAFWFPCKTDALNAGRYGTAGVPLKPRGYINANCCPPNSPATWEVDMGKCYPASTTTPPYYSDTPNSGDGGHHRWASSDYLTFNNPPAHLYLCVKRNYNFDFSAIHAAWRAKYGSGSPAMKDLRCHVLGGVTHTVHTVNQISDEGQAGALSYGRTAYWDDIVHASGDSGAGTQYEPQRVREQTWLTEELIFKQNTPGVADGLYKVYEQGRLVHDPYPELVGGNSGCMPNHRAVPAGGALLQRWTLDNLNSFHDPEVLSGMLTYVDYIYADDSWCHVVISDEPTYQDPYESTASATLKEPSLNRTGQSSPRGQNWTAGTDHLREPQIIATWNDTTITFTLRQGSHASLSGKYLYVMTDDGTVFKVGQFS